MTHPAPAEPSTLPEALTMADATDEIEALLSAEEALSEPDSVAEPQETRPLKPQRPEVEAVETEEPDEDTPEKEPEPDEPEKEDEEPEPEEDAEDEPAPTPKTYKVPVDGEEIEVTEDELLKGYSRTAHFTRKSQELSKERQEFQAVKESTLVDAQKYSALLGQLEEQLAPQIPQNVDWDRLRAEDPALFAEQWAEYQYRVQGLEQVRREKADTDRKLGEEQAAQRNGRIKEEGEKLISLIPDWTDPVKRKTEKKELAEYALSIGFTDNELKLVDDHRPMLLLRKAMLYDREQAAKKVTKQAVRQKIDKASSAKPGPAGAVKSRVTTDLEKANRKLAQTGSRDDAVAATMKMLEAEERAQARARRRA